MRTFATTWIATLLLPLPALMTVNPTFNAEISCLYLGLASAWLAIHTVRSEPLPLSRRLWRLYAALAINLVVFVTLGLAAAVESRLPFPIMAMLSVIPAMGLIPCLTLRIKNPLTVIIFAAVIELSAKLTGCVVARIVYGPDFQIEGRIAGDWTTARLMISTFWIISSSLSLVALGAAFLIPGRTPPAASNDAPCPSI
jgi:hypothetical protein